MSSASASAAVCYRYNCNSCKFGDKCKNRHDWIPDEMFQKTFASELKKANKCTKKGCVNLRCTWRHELVVSVPAVATFKSDLSASAPVWIPKLSVAAAAEAEPEDAAEDELDWLDNELLEMEARNRGFESAEAMLEHDEAIQWGFSSVEEMKAYDDGCAKVAMDAIASDSDDDE